MLNSDTYGGRPVFKKELSLETTSDLYGKKSEITQQSHGWTAALFQNVALELAPQALAHLKRMSLK